MLMIGFETGCSKSAYLNVTSIILKVKYFNTVFEDIFPQNCM